MFIIVFFLLLRFTFSNVVLLRKRSADYLNIQQPAPINGFFLSWWYRHFPRWQCRDSCGSTCETKDLWDVLERPDSPIINTRSGRNMNTALVGNKCCETAEDATGNVWRNHKGSPMKLQNVPLLYLCLNLKIVKFQLIISPIASPLLLNWTHL